MTVSSTTSKATGAGNGSATVFSFSPLTITASSELDVWKTDAAGLETLLVEGTGPSNYSVSVASYPGTGSVVYPASGTNKLATGEKLTMKRVLPLTQATALENQGGYFPDVQESAFDKLTQLVIQLQEAVDRTLKLPVSDATVLQDLPPAVLRASQGLAFDASGQPLVGSLSSTAIAAAMVPVVQAATTVLGLAALGARGAQNFKAYAASGTFVKATDIPAWVQFVTVHVWGAGGGGAGGNSTSTWRGTGGGGGAYSLKRIAVSSLAASETVTVGTAGAGGGVGNPGGVGTAGGTSSFGAFVTCTGGAAGQPNSTAGEMSGVLGGVAAGGDVNMNGGQSGISPHHAALGSSSGGNSPRGGSGGNLNVAQAGNFPGGGGSCGNHTAGNGGNGANGFVLVEW